MIPFDFVLRVSIQSLLFILVMTALLFLPAGTFLYWEGWAFLAAFLIPTVFITLYLYKNDPALLKRRMKRGEQRPIERMIMAILSVLLTVSFVFAALDHRFGWSQVPWQAVVIADVLIVLGFSIVFLTFKVNTYTSRVIEIDKGQKVITTGPYAIVRHPMYLGSTIMILATPVALGSWWTLIGFALVIPFIMLRAVDEEKLLTKGLPGYAAYRKKVTYRLVPGVW